MSNENETDGQEDQQEQSDSGVVIPVSYTHLTLPTIYSV